MVTTEPNEEIAPAAHHHSVTLAVYNTLHLTPHEVYHLMTPYAGPYAALAGEASAVYVNLLNLGPGTVYIRADEDPDDDDPHSETLPPGTADNLVLIPNPPEGLRLRAIGPRPTTITIRLVQG